jgi:hypothetical protein
MSEPIYDKARERRLVELLRALAQRIEELKSDGALLAAGPELLKMMGDARSELFHYEVRCTYDTPEIAESRRIVELARQQMENFDFDRDAGDSEEDAPWRDPQT